MVLSEERFKYQSLAVKDWEDEENWKRKKPLKIRKIAQVKDFRYKSYRGYDAELQGVEFLKSMN